jgi:2Fe-2S ferredoxin
MTRVTFMLANGQARTVDAREGDSVMRAAVDAGIEAIEGICGGGLSCATCHVYVDEKWIVRVHPPREDELALLDFTEAPRMERSRLGCQIALTNDLDGLVVQVPVAR